VEGCIVNRKYINWNVLMFWRHNIR